MYEFMRMFGCTLND